MTGNLFPQPQWLHLYEVPAYVVERKGLEPLGRIVQAIRDGQLRTRAARRRPSTGDEIQAPISARAWDDAKVYWEAGLFTAPAPLGRTWRFEKVDVLRAGMFGLDQWLDLTPAQPIAADPPQAIDASPAGAGEAVKPSTPKPPSRPALRRWYTETWIPQHANAERSPSRDDDLAAARVAFDPQPVPRDWMRQIRKEDAPENWRRHGRPPAKPL